MIKSSSSNIINKINNEKDNKLYKKVKLEFNSSNGMKEIQTSIPNPPLDNEEKFI